MTIDLDSDDADAKIVRIIESDPVLGARLIAAANSAAFGVPGNRFFTLKAAVRRIGLRRSVQLALALLFGNAVNRRLSASLNEALWLHALTVASAAQEIARLKRLPEPGSAYFVGLMHDLGYMAMEFMRPGSLTEIGALMKHENIDWEQAEIRIFGAHHQLVAGTLLTQWAVPAELVDPIRRHHDLDLDADSIPAILLGAEKMACCEDIVEILYAGLEHPLRSTALGRGGVEFFFDQQLEMNHDAVDRLIQRITEQVVGLREASQAMGAPH